MRGSIDMKLLGQGLVKLQPPRVAPSTVQHQQRISLSAMQELHLQASNGELFFPPSACHVVSPSHAQWIQDTPVKLSPSRLPPSPFPRPSPQGTPEALPYPILRRLSRPRSTALHLAAGRSGGRPRRTRRAARAAGKA